MDDRLDTRTSALGAVGSSVRDRAVTLRRREARRRVVLTVLAVAVLVGAAAWALLASPWLRLERVEVIGGDDAQRLAVRQATEPLMGQPLVKVDTMALQQRLASAPDFSRVDVLRNWPDRLSVTLVTRVPVVAVKQREGQVELLDASGVQFAQPPAAPKGVPVATLAHPDQERERQVAASAMGALDAGQRARVGAVTVASPDDVTFEMDSVKVVWGGPSDGRQKAMVLAALLQQKGVRTINVSAPDSPVAS